MNCCSQPAAGLIGSSATMIAPASRLGSGRDQSRVAAMLLLTLRGTPTIYYGDELGMIQVSVPAERVSDPLERNMPGFGLGRDGARTPMQWDGPSSVDSPATNLGCLWLTTFRTRNVFNQAQIDEFDAQPLPTSDLVAAKHASARYRLLSPACNPR